MTHNPINRKDVATAWTPDLFGPIFKKHSLTLKQALDLRNVNEQIHRMATFVPDEVIYAKDLSVNCLRSFPAVLMFLNLSGFSMLFKKYIHDKNGGSLALTKTLNDYIYIVIREIYCSEGDILKFSAEGLLAAWKVREGKFMFDAVQNVIIRAMTIQNSIALKDISGICRVNIGISAGDVTFSVIGSNKFRHFVVFGLPIEELKDAKKVSLPNDVVLSLSAWRHCTPSQYEYVLKDPHNVKITRILQQSDAKSTYVTPTSPNDYFTLNYEIFQKGKLTNAKSSSPYRAHLISTNGKSSETEVANTKEKVSTAISAIAAVNPNFGAQLKSYLIKPVIQQIEKDESLRFLAEIRRITVIALDIIPDKRSNNELILLIDQCFLLLHSIVTQYEGCINMMNLYDKNIFFCIAFGIHGHTNNEDQFKIDETCKNGITCAMHILRTVKTVAGVQSTFIGVSTGIAYCGVIGHIARRYYAIIGPPVDKAIKIMDISHDKVSCDYDTVLHSHFDKNQFRSRGIRTLRRLEKYHVYEYLGDTSIRENLDATSSLDYCYPILGRMQELEYFNDVLDEIGVADRKYSGLLIEGVERSGKSRLLDAFVTSVCNRQIRPIKLSLHVTYAEKAYSVIYHVILQILKAENCETVDEREKVLLDKLGDVLALEDFCYLNVLMRVRFPLSDTYCLDPDWRRHTKTIDIFETILKQLKTKICILLDDIQHMDNRSWQFLSSALNNNNIVIGMTMPKPNSWDDLSHVEAEIYQDKRLTKHTLPGLDLDLLPVFACQFLNVLAISKKLSRILQRRKDGHIGWCEAFLTSILQNNGLDFIRISPTEAIQRDLVFPNSSLVTKLPVDLMPEEIAPPLPWSQMNLLDVCVTNKTYFKITDKDCDMTELMSKIYDRMNPYEQDFIKCAATLGRVFKRSMIENVMLNSIPPHTTKTVSEMFRMRVLECASLQRRDFHSEDLIFCIDKKRQTFSDMQHMLSCHCYQSRAPVSRNPSPLNADCKMLEFRIESFRKTMYNVQTNEEKQEHHRRAARMYGLDARKCNFCGSGRFLRVPSVDVFKEMEKEDAIVSPRVSLIRRRTIIVEDRKWAAAKKPSELTTETITVAKKQDTIDICRVSIMPTINDEEDEVIIKRDKSEGTKGSLRFRKRSSSVSPEITKDPSRPSCLEKFSHIDYRDCECDSVISHLFWRLHWHIEKNGENNKVLEFFLEYSAGMIQIAQPLYAIKLLSIAAEKSKVAEMDEWIQANVENSITNKGIILALMGDAYSALGNYDQARKYYLSAVKLRGTPPKTKKGICYNATLKLFCKFQDSSNYTVDEETKQLAIKKLELASYLRRLCVIFMIDDKLKTAQSFALRSFKLAFQSINSFLEKGEIYLATVQVLQRTRNIKLIRHIERPMLIVIKRKTSWDDAEEVAMVANIYLTMYQVSVLRGELEKAVDFGTKVLKISGSLHLHKLMLITVPSLIQIMLWTKRINEVIDLMRELYFLADEDVDLSAKTWYYALSLDLMLDAGIVLESYETSYNYYEKFIAYRPKSCVWRDPQSVCRLLTGLWTYQLRMRHAAINAFVHSTEEYVKDVSCHDFSRILTCSKGLECYLLILLRCVNMKSSYELLDVIPEIFKIIKCLKNVSKHAKVIKPRLYLLMAYLNVLRGRKPTMRIYLYRAQKFAMLQGNQLIMAWIIQNRRTWREKIFNNMARYWLDYVESADIVTWQYIRNFSIDIWSTILYPLPTPDVHL